MLESAITSHDCTEQPLVTRLTWIGVWWVAKKQDFMPWTKGKHRLTSPGQKFSTHLQPPWSFFPVPRGKKGIMAGPIYKTLSLSGGPWYKFPCGEPKRRSLIAITTLHCTLDTNNTQRQSTASACYCSSADGVAAKLSLQDWEMDFLFYKQDHVQMNWGSPTDHRKKIYYWAIFLGQHTTCHSLLSSLFCLFYSRNLFACSSAALQSWFSATEVGGPCSESLPNLLLLFLKDMA